MVLGRTATVLEHGIASGLHIGAQVYVSRHGRTVADFAIGQSRPGVAMSTGTVMLWMSASKPVGAVAVARLWERGLLHLDDPVAKFTPEFGGDGKDGVTLRHILTHTSGVKWTDIGWPHAPWAQIVAQVSAMHMGKDARPGAQAAYSPYASWFLLAEVIRRLDGRPFEQYVREEIFLSLGMTDSWFAVPVQTQHAYGDRWGVMQVMGEAGPRPLGFDTEVAAAACRPSGSGRGPVRQLGRFYEMLLARGENILRPQTVEALTARHRVGMKDRTFGAMLDWGLGVIVNSRHYGGDPPYGYGPHASPRTFGHGGSQSSCAYCDPEAGLVVAWTCNGMPGEPRHHTRQRELNTAIYEDLNLT